MGSVEDTYSVQTEAERILSQGILNNELLPTLPWEIKAAAKHVTFTGTQAPSIPINWRFAESVSALKAFEASMLNVLRLRKYGDQGAKMSEVEINTDHATLFIMSCIIGQYIDEEDGGKPKPLSLQSGPEGLAKLGFPNADLHDTGRSLHRNLATNIYKTKDGRFFHTHGSLNPEPILTALKMPLDAPDSEVGKEDYEQVAKRFTDVVGQWDSAELDRVVNEKYRQAGTIAYSAEEFAKTEHGKANAHVGLYELVKEGQSEEGKGIWWKGGSKERPLEGLKVIDLTRIIAAPTVTRGLAEMGASVMRVTSPHVTDMSSLHPDLNWGKWNTHLHLKDASDRETLISLIKEADIVVEGYRPSVMAKYGLSRADIFALKPGIVHVRENCYGWHGPWAHRSGWQQISDAVCGVSHAYGRAIGAEGAVTPVFPNSDYCTGIIGASAILHALINKFETGGSYGVDISLNYYSQWLVRFVGTYPEEVWQEVWDRHGKPKFENWHNMHYLLPKTLALLQQHDKDVLFKQEYFEARRSKALGKTFVMVKPVAQWMDRAVQLEFNVGTRGNGKDKPYWPDNLRTEVVV